MGCSCCPIAALLEGGRSCRWQAAVARAPICLCRWRSASTTARPQSCGTAGRAGQARRSSAGLTRKNTLAVFHVLQPLDPAGFDTGLAGVGLGRVLVRLGFADFAAFLLLALGHEMFQSGEMPAEGVGLLGRGVNVVGEGRKPRATPATHG